MKLLETAEENTRVKLGQKSKPEKLKEGPDTARRREIAYKWYRMLKKPKQATMYRLVEATTLGHEITKADINLLPWDEEKIYVKEDLYSCYKKELLYIAEDEESFSNKELLDNSEGEETLYEKGDLHSSNIKKLDIAEEETRTQPRLTKKTESVKTSTDTEKRRESAYEWYKTLKKPKQATMYRLVEATTLGHDITKADIDLLPWDEEKIYVKEDAYDFRNKELLDIAEDEENFNNKELLDIAEEEESQYVKDDVYSSKMKKLEIAEEETMAQPRLTKTENVKTSTDTEKRRETAYEWYKTLKKPKQATMYRLVEATTLGHEITKADIDLLPWDEAKIYVIEDAYGFMTKELLDVADEERRSKIPRDETIYVREEACSFNVKESLDIAKEERMPNLGTKKMSVKVKKTSDTVKQEECSFNVKAPLGVVEEERRPNLGPKKTSVKVKKNSDRKKQEGEYSFNVKESLGIAKEERRPSLGPKKTSAKVKKNSDTNKQEEYSFTVKESLVIAEEVRMPDSGPKKTSAKVKTNPDTEKRRESAYEWYKTLNKPKQATMYRLVEATTLGHEITKTDIDLLPWDEDKIYVKEDCLCVSKKELVDVTEEEGSSKIPESIYVKRDLHSLSKIGVVERSPKLELKKKPDKVKETPDTEKRRETAYEWYKTLKKPKQATMYRLVEVTTLGHEITKEDIDLLPWDEEGIYVKEDLLSFDKKELLDSLKEQERMAKVARDDECYVVKEDLHSSFNRKELGLIAKEERRSQRGLNQNTEKVKKSPDELLDVAQEEKKRAKAARDEQSFFVKEDLLSFNRKEMLAIAKEERKSQRELKKETKQVKKSPDTEKRKERAYELYKILKNPKQVTTKETMYRLVEAKTLGHEITKADIDLLPWDEEGNFVKEDAI